MSEKKKQKVIRILDEYTIIINAGSEDGVKKGDKYQILDTEGSSVEDPDTGEVLGYLDLIKDTVEVTETQEKMCFCSSMETISISKAISMAGIHSLQNSLSTFSPEKKRLNIELDDVTGGRQKSNSPIKIGDKVRLIKS